MNSILNFIVWNPDPELFSIFGISIRYYSMMWALGLGLAYYIVRYLYKDQNIPEKQFEPLFFYCFFGVLIGARLGHCLFYEPMQYLSSVSGIIEMLLPIKFTAEGMKFVGYQGLASHGGTIGLMIALYLYMRKTGVNLFTVLDNIALAVPLTACCIRLGNFFNSEIIGKPTGSDWGVVFAQVDNIPRHPAQFYEAMAYLAFFIIGFIIYKKFKGKLHKGFFFGYCLITIFTFRFFIEFIKENQVAFEENMTLDMGQWLSIPFVLIGIASIALGKKIDKLDFSKVQKKKKK